MEERDRQTSSIRRSESFHNIIGDTPSWLIRWGTTVAAAVVVLLLLLGAVVRYPETISGRVTLTSKRAPTQVVAPTGAQIASVRARDSAVVDSGEVLAVLNAPARLSDVQAVSQWVDSVKTYVDGPGAVPPSDWPSPPRFLQLGDLKDDFSTAQEQLLTLRSHVSAAYRATKSTDLARRIEERRDLIASLKERVALAEEDLEIARREYRRAKQLEEKDLVSTEKVEETRSQYLEKQTVVEDLRSQVKENRIRLLNLKDERTEFERNYDTRRQRLEAGFRQALQRLESRIAGWRERYLLIAPLHGRVSHLKILQEGQFVEQSEVVMSITPEAPRTVVGRMDLPQSRSGRVHVGQRVRVRLDSYPASQYGTVWGRIERISEVAWQEKYLVVVDFPDDLTTSYDRSLDFRQGMTGTAEIVTSNQTVLQRLAYRLIESTQ